MCIICSVVLPAFDKGIIVDKVNSAVLPQPFKCLYLSDKAMKIKILYVGKSFNKMAWHYFTSLPERLRDREGFETHTCVTSETKALFTVHICDARPRSVKVLDYIWNTDGLLIDLVAKLFLVPVLLSSQDDISGVSIITKVCSHEFSCQKVIICLDIFWHRKVTRHCSNPWS